MNEQCIIFLHIHKTGGLTFQNIFHNQYPPEKRFHFTNPPFCQGSDALPPKDYDAILGYELFGIHTVIKRPFKYVTFIREPVSRTISEFYYAVTHGGWAHTSGHRTIETWVKSCSEHFPNWANQQILRFGAIGRSYYPERMNAIVRPRIGNMNHELEKAILDAALKNLEKYFIAGVTDRFRESIVIIAKKFGWKLPIRYKKTNISDPRPTTSNESIRLIKKGSQSDQKLYDRACVLLDTEIEKYDGNFEADLRLVKDIT